MTQYTSDHRLAATFSTRRTEHGLMVENHARYGFSTAARLEIHNAQDAHPHPSHAGRQLKMYYGTQVRSDPPTFMIYVNEPKLMHFTYLRYLENQIREEYGFLGTPIRIVTKGRRE